MCPLTKIVATLGPSSEDERTVRRMVEAGMNVARINCSHGDWETRKERIDLVRRISKETKISIAILVDLQGPKIRTGDLPKEGVDVFAGEKLTLTTIEANADYESKHKKIHIRNYPDLANEVEKGQRVLFDDGLIRVEVVKTTDTEVESVVTFGGILKSNKGVNLPDSVQKSVQSITEKDREDIKRAVEYGADFIALSFVRCPEDILELKDLINKEKPKCPVKTMAKIEKPQALDKLDEIIDVVDVIMVARGDLGVELEPEQVPLVQKDIISRTNKRGKLVITATQMMDSMINNPFPTRAEVSDVANAIFDGTDAVMLSGETASGKYPVESVDYMRKIATEVETKGQIKVEDLDLDETDENKTKVALAHSIESFLRHQEAEAVVAFSCSGASIQTISKFRPKTRIIAATTYQHTYNYLALVWGVTPVFFDAVESTSKTFINVEEKLLELGHVKEGESILITGGLPIAARSSANFLKFQKCDGSMKASIKKGKEEADKDLGPLLKV